MAQHAVLFFGVINLHKFPEIPANYRKIVNTQGSTLQEVIQYMHSDLMYIFEDENNVDPRDYHDHIEVYEFSEHGTILHKGIKTQTTSTMTKIG